MTLSLPSLSSPISKYFLLKDSIYLPQWNIYAYPDNITLNNIIETASKMDLIINHLNIPRSNLIINCWWRPIKYNEFIGSKAKSSQHILGKAVDFYITTMKTEIVKINLLPKLQEFNIRMENNTGNWIHIDTKPCSESESRFFKP